MNWYDLSFYDMHKIIDEHIKREYLRKYYLYTGHIAGPIIDGLKSKGYSFSYVGNVNKIPVKEQVRQLQAFYKDILTKDEIDKIVGVVRK